MKLNLSSLSFLSLGFATIKCFARAVDVDVETIDKTVGKVVGGDSIPANQSFLRFARRLEATAEYGENCGTDGDCFTGNCVTVGTTSTCDCPEASDCHGCNDKNGNLCLRIEQSKAYSTMSVCEISVWDYVDDTLNHDLFSFGASLVTVGYIHLLQLESNNGVCVDVTPNISQAASGGGFVLDPAVVQANIDQTDPDAV
ncbi:unknown protein [Seminavis robusta]|uniref:Uncharacterized protein n=1 Tax=Seminavis robusta TaxID=568900 RepID=A0A9N8EBB9_9STRA|nr:unknown protein [Seminavis robusta]|eukprot:Sro919_g220120.1 n/a (199) ;mRNA; r:28544-29140